MDLEPLHPIQIRRFREMSPSEKWGVARGLLKTARETRLAALRQQHPAWSAEDIERAVAREMARART
ncbi:MAG: hypothetical protein IT577_00780 [Verrucomicrobiae bacterium]|nr:hypothetical protein [Verrucomicrobiae bacterium]